jgi:hypothetical protein
MLCSKIIYLIELEIHHHKVVTAETGMKWISSEGGA